MALSAALDQEIECVALREGDILLVDPDNCVLGIERKTVPDFLASLADGRLVAQLTRMSESYGQQMLLLEGAYTVDGQGFISLAIGTRWTHPALQMALWSIQRHFPDLVVLWSNSLGCTADIVRALANRGRTKGCFSATTLFAGQVDMAEASSDSGHLRAASTRLPTRRRRHAASDGR